MFDCFRRWSRRTKPPARARGQARAPCRTAACRLHLEKLEDRALPGNILFGGLLALPGQSAPSPLDDSEDLAAMVRTSSPVAGGSALAAGLSAASPSSADPLPATDLDSLGGLAPLPIPLARTNPFGRPTIHFDRPGLPTDPPPDGSEPSTINNFDGFIGVVHGTGTGTDGSGHMLTWDADLRFMQGVYQGIDGELHRGTFAFV